MFGSRSKSSGQSPPPAGGEDRAAGGEDRATGGEDRAEALVLVDRALHPFLVSIHEPYGFRAEQVRGLRNKLVALNPDGAPRTLVVTSAVQGEGKTVTAINLGVSFAELEVSKVLVVDADLRNPSVEACLGMDAGPGLSELLLGAADLGGVLRPSGIGGLWVLGAGACPARPSELLASRRMDDLLARLKEEFHYILVDTPGAIPITDAGVLSAKTDGTLLVVRLEAAPRALIQEAVRNIQDVGGNLLGVFVTAVRGADPHASERYAYRVREEQ